ncbi:MAG: hypothetical protein KGL43_05730 [Burkholderiales bacterium]|nr:hypothetical protein [Burkholderiales bacterium]MDE2397939.1 hypothetical protein [Burkholderiales bacterium]MDE2453073.1 hypothetical protein [Burkholderiales bacterium]
MDFGTALGADGVDPFSDAVLTPGRIDFAAVSLLSGANLLPLQSGTFSLARLTFYAVAAGSSNIAFDLTTPPGLQFGDEFGAPLPVTVGGEAFVSVDSNGVSEPATMALVLAALLGAGRVTQARCRA